jgi:SPOR domain
VRNLFLALLLANLLFLGWQLWIAPPDIPADRLRTAGPEPEIQAATRSFNPAGEGTAAGDGSSTPGSRTTPLPPPGSCVRIGPIADGQVADSVRMRLKTGGFDATVAVEEGQIWVGHWVQLESVGSREEADRIVGRLSAGGIPDAYVLQTDPPFAISLGVFRDKERADKVLAAAASLGFQPQMTDRYRAGVQYWLSFVVPVGGSLSLGDLEREFGQTLRAEPVACQTTSIGGAELIN